MVARVSVWPSTAKTWPEIRWPWGEQRNSAVSAMSSASTKAAQGGLLLVAGAHIGGRGAARRRLGLDHPVHARAVDRAGRNRVDPNAGRPQLHGERLGETDHRPLGRGIGRAQRIAHDAGGRGDVDDRAGAGRLHDRHRLAQAEKGAVDIDLKGRVPCGQIHGLDRPGRPGDPGVVDQHVEPAAETRQGRLEQARDRALVGDVRDQRAEPLVRPLHLGDPGRVQIADLHLGALGREGQRDRPADPAAAGGHQDAGIGEGQGGHQSKWARYWATKSQPTWAA